MRKTSSRKKKRLLSKILILIIILLILFLVLCYLTREEDGLSSSGIISSLEIPALIPGEQVVEHLGYVLSYNEEYEVASWVAYELTRDEVLGTQDRADNFRADPEIITQSASLADYRGSGYDRGHLAPAADFKWSADAMSDTFYLSNMTPQNPSFNRGIWAALESVVRTFAYDNENIYVVTGPVLTDGPFETIGSNNVAVPKRFYKVILDYTDPEIKAIGFVLPNENSSASLQSFAMSVDDVEKITGIDFFPLLPDDEESVIEATFDVNKWNFNQFSAKGETASQSLEYVTKTNSSDSSVISLMSELFVELKKSIFDLLGITNIAKSLGLL